MLKRVPLVFVLLALVAILPGCPPREYASGLRQADSL